MAFEPKQFHLPQLTLGGTLALAAKLIAAAKAEKELPPELARTSKRIKQAHDDMARAKRERVVMDPDKKVRAKLRQKEMVAWTALQQTLAAWSRVALPDAGEQVAAALQLDAAFFDEESIFRKRRFEVSWKEADERLKLIEEHDLDGAIETLGIELFLENIEAAHRASGAHLGITKRKVDVTQDRPAMRELSEVLKTAMREYMVQVAGHAVTDRKAKALAGRLLAPIAEWRQVRTPKRSVESKPVESKPAAIGLDSLLPKTSDEEKRGPGAL